MSLSPSYQMKKKTRMNRLIGRKFLHHAIWLIYLVSFFLSASLTFSENLLNKQPEEAVLSNGLTLIYQEDDASPTSVVQILIRGGRRREPAGKQGLAFLTTRLCLEFPNQRSIEQMMNQATRTSMFCRHDFTLIKISCLSENLEEAIKLNTQILQKPLFSGLRIERVKELMNHQRKQLDDELINVAHTAALDTLFAATSYAGSDYGTEESLKNIKKKDIETFYDVYVRAGNMVVAISSDLKKESAIEILRPYLEKFTAGKPSDPEAIPFSPSEERSLFLEKDTQQSMVYLAFPLPKVSSRNYILTNLLENLLGKGVNSKLWPLRAEEKLAYVVNAQSFVMREGGILEVYLETDQTKIETAMEALKKIIQNLSEEGISAEEFEITKSHSKGSFMRESETKDDKTYNLVAFEALELGYKFLNQALSEMDATSLEEFNTFMKEVLSLDKAVEIIVGPKALENQISQMP
jgi:zinc protease